MDINKEVQRFMRISKNHNASVNPNQTMVSRGIATIQGTVAQYFPEVDLFKEIKEYAIEYQLSNIKNKEKDGDIERLRKLMELRRIKEIPGNVANMVELYSKGLAPVQIEMGVPEKSQGFITEIIRLLIDGFIIVALLISSSIIVLSGLPPTVWGMPLLGLIGYSLSVLMILIRFVKRIWKK